MSVALRLSIQYNLPLRWFVRDTGFAGFANYFRCSVVDVQSQFFCKSVVARHGCGREFATDNEKAGGAQVQSSLGRRKIASQQRGRKCSAAEAATLLWCFRVSSLARREEAHHHDEDQVHHIRETEAQYLRRIELQEEREATVITAVARNKVPR